jgi:hypothetical protein
MTEITSQYVERVVVFGLLAQPDIARTIARIVVDESIQGIAVRALKCGGEEQRDALRALEKELGRHRVELDITAARQLVTQMTKAANPRVRPARASAQVGEAPE